MKRIVLIFLLLTAAAWGNQVSLTGGELGYVAVDGDTITISGTKASFEHWGILIDGSSNPDTIVVNLGTDTLEYNTADHDSSFGIMIYGSYNADAYIKISGGLILDGQPDSTALKCVGLSLMGCHSLYAYDVDINVKGRNTNAVTTSQLSDNSKTYYGQNDTLTVYPGTFKNIHLKKLDIWQICRYYTRRDYYFASAIKANEFDASLSEGEYSIFLDSCNVHECGHAAISLDGSLVYVYGCSTHVDTWNWYSDSTHHDQTYDNINAWGIITANLGHGSKIIGNAFTSGNDFSGCAGGILVQVYQGTIADPCSVSYNRIHKLTSGFSWYTGGVYLLVNGIRVRWGVDNTYLVGNEIELYYGATDSLNSINRAFMGDVAAGIDIYSEIEGEQAWAHSAEPCSNLVVENNIINCIPISDAYGPSNTTGGFGIRCGISPDMFAATGCYLKNNYIHAPRGYYLHSSYAYQHYGDDFLTIGDTVSLIDSNYSGDNNYVVTMPYYWGNEAIDNHFRDIVVSSPFTIEDSYIVPTITNGDATFEYTCSLLVVDGNGYNSPNIPVYFIDNYDDTTYDTTNGSGWASQILKVYKLMEDGDSTFNDYIFKAKIGTDSTADTLTISSSNNTDTLTLAKFYGTGPMPTTFYVFWDHSSVGDGTMNENGDSTLYYNFKREFIRIMADSGFTCYFVDYRHNSSNPYGGVRTSKRDMTPDGSDDDLGYGRNVNGLCIDWGTITWNMYFSYFNDFWEQARNNSTHFGKLTLGDTLWDTTAEPDTVIEIWPGMFADNPDSVGFIWIVKSSYFPYGYTPQMSDSLHLVYRSEINEFSDSINAHPRIIGVVGLGGSLALGGPGAPNSTSRANTMELSNYVLDTLVTLYDNVKALSFYDWIVNKNAGSAYYLYTDSAYSYGGDGDHPGPFGYKVLHDSMLYVWLPVLITDLKAYYDTTTQEEEPPPDSTISTSITCTDTTYNSIRIECSFTLENCTVDSSIFYCDAISTKLISPTNPDTVNFGGLYFEESYDCYVISYSTCGIDYSDTLSITTEAESEGFDNSGWTLLHSMIFDDTTYSMADGDSVGDNSWLTVQLYGNATLEVQDGYAQLTTPNYTDMALFHSTDTLPDEYLIRTKWGYINYDTSNYEAADSDAYSISADYVENGIYLLIISDSILANENCNESIWHHRRKINIDIDNSPNGIRPIYFVYFDTAQLGGMDAIRSWDGAVWDSSEWNWNVGYTYAESTYYWVELKKENDEWTIKFYDENENLLVECDPVPIELCTQYEKSDYLYMGEPHNDDYEGDARIMEVNLYIPTEEGVSNKYIGILK